MKFHTILAYGLLVKYHFLCNYIFSLSPSTDEQTFRQRIQLIEQNGRTLYLDSKMADVYFVVGAYRERVPAHKCILAAGSSVFETMLYGSIAEKGDVLIVDATADAFKEFLQFFYLTEYTLTSRNIFDVANLCKKYDVTDGLAACETPMKDSLTIENMCTGYKVARLLELHDVIAYCEDEIQENPDEIYQSPCFSQCDAELFDKILQLITSPHANAPNDFAKIIDCCMDWAEAQCTRKNFDTTPANLKMQLRDSLHRMPFDELKAEEFSQFMEKYDGFLDKADLGAIITQMLPNKKSRWD